MRQGEVRVRLERLLDPFAGRQAVLEIGVDRRLVVSLRKAAGLDVDWRIHDIRRGVATGLGEHLQASEELVGQVLGHSKLSRIGITAAYDKAERMGARGQLLEAWARKLVEAANGKVESNVVPMRVS